MNAVDTWFIAWNCRWSAFCTPIPHPMLSKYKLANWFVTYLHCAYFLCAIPSVVQINYRRERSCTWSIEHWINGSIYVTGKHNIDTQYVCEWHMEVRDVVCLCVFFERDTQATKAKRAIRQFTINRTKRRRFLFLSEKSTTRALANWPKKCYTQKNRHAAWSATNRDQVANKPTNDCDRLRLTQKSRVILYIVV